MTIGSSPAGRPLEAIAFSLQGDIVIRHPDAQPGEERFILLPAYVSQNPAALLDREMVSLLMEVASEGGDDLAIVTLDVFQQAVMAIAKGMDILANRITTLEQKFKP